MLNVSSMVLDPDDRVEYRNGYIAIGHNTVVTEDFKTAVRLATAAWALVEHLRPAYAAGYIDPEPDGPLAIPETELRALAGDR